MFFNFHHNFSIFRRVCTYTVDDFLTNLITTAKYIVRNKIKNFGCEDRFFSSFVFARISIVFNFQGGGGYKSVSNCGFCLIRNRTVGIL